MRQLVPVDFEQGMISNLAEAGEGGKIIARFMQETGIHIGYGRTWYPNWFSAWWDARRRMVVLDAADFDIQTLKLNLPFLLNIIAHELDHIRITWEYQDSWIPAGLSKYGELRGWKLGYAVQHAVTGKPPLPGTCIARLLALDLEAEGSIRLGTQIIKQHQSRVRHGWVYSLFFSLLPARPWGKKKRKRSARTTSVNQ